jgi:hypothetical protein
MKDPAAELRRTALDYRAALEKGAQVEEGIASTLAMMAAELNRQGQSQIAEMLQQASHYHRSVSIKSCAIAASLSVDG